MCNNNSLVLKDGRAAFVGDSIFMLVELKMTMSKYPRSLHVRAAAAMLLLSISMRGISIVSTLDLISRIPTGLFLTKMFFFPL